MLDAAEYRIPSMRHRVSPEEWQARIDLAACYRLVDLYHMSDLIREPRLGPRARRGHLPDQPLRHAVRGDLGVVPQSRSTMTATSC